MSADVVFEDDRWRDLGLEALAERAFVTSLARLGLEGERYEIAVLACDDNRIAALNAAFRGKLSPTNVLSWPSAERAAKVDGDMPALPDPAGEAELGDLAIAYDTCLREAAAAAIDLSAHTTHLLVHGLLHLLGFDHERDRDATLMEGLETEILGKLGIADPYRV